MPRRVLRAFAVSTLTLLVVLASLLVGPPVTADDGDGTADGRHAEPLDRADGAERTLVLRDLFLARPTLEGLGREVADGLLARPTDRSADPFGDGYDAPSVRACRRHVCVHWVRRGADAPASRAWVETTLGVMEKVWRHHVGRLGYRAPAPDGRRGGDARFDVYLKDLGAQGLYGYCAPERRVAGSTHRAVGYCVLDDDFSRAQYARPPMQSLRMTASHEFFHAIQFNYDFAEDPWLLESTATWMEEQFADGVDDNRSFLPAGQIGQPGVPLDRYDTAGLAHYGNWTWWQFLAGRLGTDVVRKVIELTPRTHSVAALRRVLGSRGGLGRRFAGYALGNTAPARTYPEGAAYRAAPVPERRLGPRSPRGRLETRVDHLASASLRLRPGPRVGDGARVRLRVDAGPRSAAVLMVQRRDGTARSRRIALDRDGRGSALARFSPSVRSVTVTVANVSTRYRCDRGTVYACHGVPRDDGRPVVVRAALA
ncbi:hypothetical protein GCM10023340_44180 [Nocardioides marinquilinus]|uniref:Uncharacterized protein n=1 Tax=Nocardioides marinquilinus TaxID=1210400 RepID=A0ABP9Q5D8_9ACTN